MDKYFPVVKIKGTSKERGEQHGSLLKDRIHKTISFYKKQISLPEDDIMSIAGQFRDNTKIFSSDLYSEIEALAKAAQVNPLWIYALNGRTELLNLNPMECTSLAYKQKGLIGQNWDWDMEMEELAVILEIEKPNGHLIMTMTEPGMVGKIGMNNFGVGVCLNFMSIDDYKPSGIPLHVLLRAILDSNSLSAAMAIISSGLIGKVGNILMADSNGRIEDLELAGDEFFSIPVGDAFVHTNHFLTKVDYDLKLFPNTTGRYNRAKTLLGAVDQLSIDSMKKILKDGDGEQYPICRKRFSHPWLTDDTSITVTSIIMDLKNLQFHITRGNPFDNPFSVFSLRQRDVHSPAA